MFITDKKKNIKLESKIHKQKFQLKLENNIHLKSIFLHTIVHKIKMVKY